MRKLCKGGTDVDNNWKQQLHLNDRGLRPAAYWKEHLPDSFIWFDYMCMPQPARRLINRRTWWCA